MLKYCSIFDYFSLNEKNSSVKFDLKRLGNSYPTIVYAIVYYNTKKARNKMSEFTFPQLRGYLRTKRCWNA